MENLFENKCRTCGVQSDQLTNIYTLLDDESIIGMLLMCSGLVIQEDDLYPKEMCSDCLLVLSQSYDFRKKCELTEREFKRKLIQAEKVSLKNIVKPPNCEAKPPQTQSVRFKDEIDEEAASVYTLPTLKDDIMEQEGEINEEINLEPEYLDEQFPDQILTTIDVPIASSPTKTTETWRLNDLQIEIKDEEINDCEMFEEEFYLSDELEEVNLENDEVDIDGVFEKDTTTDLQIFVCRICSFQTNNRKELRKHSKSHDKNDSINSEERSKKIKKYEMDEYKHLKFQCFICATICQNKNGLFQHFNMDHTTDEAKKCKKKFYDSRRPRAINELRFTCEICYDRFSKKNTWIEHMECHFCDNNLKMLNSNSNLEINPKQLEQFKKLKYQCPGCKENFENKEKLFDHFKKSYSPASIEHYKQIFLKERQKQYAKIHYIFTCDICSNIFKNKCGLREHMRKHSGERPFSCEVCGRLWKTKQSLKNHMALHTGVYPLLCTICGKGFISSTDLRRHSLLHTGEKPFRCEYCPTSFSAQSNLVSHIRKHHLEKQYQCNICTRKFALKSTLNRHMWTHNGYPFCCSLCNQTYRKKKALQTHIFDAHKINVDRSVIQQNIPVKIFGFSNFKM